MRETRVALVPGDGIGVEVLAEAVKVLTAVADSAGDSVRMTPLDWGADRYLRTGETLPAGSLERLSAHFDAILLGALGDPRVPDNRHALDIRMGLRLGLDLYVHHRPVRLLHDRLCRVKGVTPADVAIDFFLESTEGPCARMGGPLKKNTADELATEVEVHTRKGVLRILRHAFAHARDRGRTRVVLADLPNLHHAHDLWRRIFREVSAECADIESSPEGAGHLALQLVVDPGRFQVIVGSNRYEDVLTNLAGSLQGGLGMAASAYLHPGEIGLFEPAPGAAPALPDKGAANPMGAILAAALMLDHCGWSDSARRIEDAVRWAVEQEKTTPDIGGRLSTREVGEAIAARLAL